MKINENLPDFNLQGIDNLNYLQASFNKEVLVIIFSCNHCPYARAYENRIIKLQEEFQEDCNFVLINSNDEVKYPEDSFENMIKRAQERKFNFPYLRDESQDVAKTFGASYTPEVFVFNKERKLKYHGRIDDNWQEEDKVTKRYLKVAIENTLKNIEIDKPENQAIGCTVKWK